MARDDPTLVIGFGTHALNDESIPYMRYVETYAEILSPASQNRDAPHENAPADTLAEDIASLRRQARSEKRESEKARKRESEKARKRESDSLIQRAIGTVRTRGVAILTTPADPGQSAQFGFGCGQCLGAIGGAVGAYFVIDT